MSEFSQRMDQLKSTEERNKEVLMKEIIESAEASGYTVADVDVNRPWGLNQIGRASCRERV